MMTSRFCFCGVMVLMSISLLSTQVSAQTKRTASEKIAPKLTALSAEGAIKQAFKQPSLDGLKALTRRGGKLSSLLVVERLPKGGYAAEVDVEVNKHHIRLPIKLKRVAIKGCAQKAWVVSWAPGKTYVNAMLNVAFTPFLPQAHTTAKKVPAWKDLKRLPSMPIVLTRYQVVTPFGVVSLKRPTGKSALDKINEMEPPADFLKHTKRWIEGYLEQAKAPASIDIISDGRTSWLNFQRIVFGASALGLFKVYIVTRQGKSFGAVESLAPVFGLFPKDKRPQPLILGYSPQPKSQHGFRVAFKNAILNKEKACAVGLSFCVADAMALDTKLQAIALGMRKKSPDAFKYALFAAPPNVLLRDAVPLLSVIGQGLEIPQRRVFIGYIGH